jgi:nucleoside-triphosphatase
MAAKLKNIFLVGESGVGKTTILQKVLSELHLNAGGFFTQEIQAGKTHKGYELLTLNGEQGVLAHTNQKSTYKVGKFGVDLKVMTDIAIPSLKDALEHKDLILIDEIGKMECFSSEFRDMVSRCIDSPKPVLGSMQNFASPLINTLTNRDDIVRITVTQANRDQLPGKIAELFKHLIPSKSIKKVRK